MGLGSFTREYDYTSYLQSVQALIAEGDIKGISLQKTMVLFSVLQANDLQPSVPTESTIGEQGIMSYVYGLLMLEGSFMEEALMEKASLLEVHGQEVHSSMRYSQNRCRTAALQ